MRPKGKLFALLAVFAAIGLVTASGAFTTVQAERTVTVNVNGDASALLGITKAADTPAFISNGSDGAETTFTIGNSSVGINENATTVLSPIVNVTNNGDEPVTLNVTANSGNSDVTVTAVNASSNKTFTQRQLGVGDTAQFGLRIEVNGNFTASDSFDITLNINATDADGS